MNKKELIKAKESENLEFKLKVDEDLGKTICAFANTEGGILLLGIDDRGEYRELIPGMTEKTAYRDLKGMEKLGLIKGIGKKKGRYYVLV
jgi:predicted HTH transcriptional regulator